MPIPRNVLCLIEKLKDATGNSDEAMCGCRSGTALCCQDEHFILPFSGITDEAPVTATTRFVPCFIPCLSSGAALCAIVVALGALLAPAQPARAQNLVADPFFTNGVPSYGSTDSFGNVNYSNNATPMTFDGVTGVDLSGPGYGYFEIGPPLLGYNPNGIDYVFTFLAAAVNPAIPTTVQAVFGYTSGTGCSECSTSYQCCPVN